MINYVHNDRIDHTSVPVLPVKKKMLEICCQNRRREPNGWGIPGLCWQRWSWRWWRLLWGV